MHNLLQILLLHYCDPMISVLFINIKCYEVRIVAEKMFNIEHLLEASDNAVQRISAH